MVELDASGSTAGKMPFEKTARESSVVASRCANVVAGAGPCSRRRHVDGCIE